ncbi:hypothetical protein ACOME3_005419 [Neoechinorhynchus agilis]
MPSKINDELDDAEINNIEIIFQSWQVSEIECYLRTIERKRGLKSEQLRSLAGNKYRDMLDCAQRMNKLRLDLYGIYSQVPGKVNDVVENKDTEIRIDRNYSLVNEIAELLRTDRCIESVEKVNALDSDIRERWPIFRVI